MPSPARPRHVAFSAKQKREQLRLKRKIKRGELDPSLAPAHSDRLAQSRVQNSAIDNVAADSARKLQSAFVKLSKDFLQHTTLLAASLALRRPIPSEAAVFVDTTTSEAVRDADANPQQLTCPKRPKWRYEMSKKEVENNEQGLFRKWIDQTDALVNTWSEMAAPVATDDSGDAGSETMPHAPTNFERNLEVWRQLWRVVEISQIILVLLDSRCPLLHYPPSLASYLASPYLSRKRTILVLTKVDIAGPVRAEEWTRHLQQKYPSITVVQVESFAEKEGSGGRRAYEPHLPSAFRQTLVDALRENHAQLLQPPKEIRDVPEKLAAWKATVKREIDWDAVLNARGGQVGQVVGGAAAPKAKVPGEHGDNYVAGHAEHAGEDDENAEPEFLTIGLIGQPNVGKSSLLNALFGTQKVRSSKTPGKTKHFQTLFWTPDVRLVDCPGLVMPNFVSMETQVLSGILPISRVSAVALCVYHAAQLLPLEEIFNLEHPDAHTEPEPDKRTWRDGTHTHAERPAKARVWTAMDILVAFAQKKGWQTAQAGRPDINRAGNFILRMLAEGRVRWAFWPPDTPAELIEQYDEPGVGLWILRGGFDSWDVDDSENEAVPEKVDADSEEESDEEELVDEEEDENEEKEEADVAVSSGAGRFAALQLAVDEGEGDESEDPDANDK